MAPDTPRPTPTRLVVTVPPGPLVALELRVRFGSGDERPHERGLAHLVEHLVVRCAMGGGRVTGGALVSASTGREWTRYRVLVREASVDQATEVLLRAFDRLTVPPRDLAAELTTVRRERAERHADPGWVLQQALLGALWEGTGLAHPVLGDPAVLDA